MSKPARSTTFVSVAKRLFRGNPNADGKTAASLVAVWRDVSLFAAAFAYLSGWAYIRSYYRAFEVDASVLDIAINNYFIYAFFALFNGWGGLLIGALAGITLLLNRLHARNLLHVVTLAVFAFGLFNVSLIEGARDGRRLRNHFQELPTVTFAFKDAEYEKRIASNSLWAGTWFLVAATRDKYVVLVQEPPDPAFPDRWPAAKSLLVPAADAVAAVQVKDFHQ